MHTIQPSDQRPGNRLQLAMMIVVTAVVVAMAAVILYRPTFGIIDDHTIVANQASGHYGVPVCVDANLRRFFPMSGQEYWLLRPFGPLTADRAYLLNAVQFALFLVIVWIHLRKELQPTWTAAAIVSLVFSTGFMHAWLRLAVPERGALFSLFAAQVLLGRADKRKSVLSAVAACVFFAIALLYKEPVFLMVGAYAVLKLVHALRHGGDRRQKVVWVVLILLCVAFAATAVSYFVAFGDPSSTSYATQRRFMPAIENAVSVLRHNAVSMNPLIFFVMIPLACVRATQTVVRRDVDILSREAELFAAMVYAAVILVLNLSPTPYYLLPVYAFGLRPIWRAVATVNTPPSLKATAIAVAIVLAVVCFPLGVVFRVLNESLLRTLILACAAYAVGVVAYARWPGLTRKTAVYAGLLLVVFNSIPESLNTAWDWKRAPIAFQATLRDTADAWRSGPAGANVFLAGSPRPFYVEAYQSVGTYLRQELGDGPFDIRSELPADARFVPNPKSPWSADRSPEASIPKPGDLLFVGPWSLTSDEQLNAFADMISRHSVEPSFRVPSLNSIQRSLKARWKTQDASTFEDYALFRVR